MFFIYFTDLIVRGEAFFWALAVTLGKQAVSIIRSCLRRFEIKIAKNHSFFFITLERSVENCLRLAKVTPLRVGHDEDGVDVVHFVQMEVPGTVDCITGDVYAIVKLGLRRLPPPVLGLRRAPVKALRDLLAVLVRSACGSG